MIAGGGSWWLAMMNFIYFFKINNKFNKNRNIKYYYIINAMQ